MTNLRLIAVFLAVCFLAISSGHGFSPAQALTLAPTLVLPGKTEASPGKAGAPAKKTEAPPVRTEPTPAKTEAAPVKAEPVTEMMGPPLPPKPAPQKPTIVIRPKQSGLYDETNPDYPTLQGSNEALGGLELDKKGAIDWMKALNSGFITPRADLLGTGKMEILNVDIIMRNTKGMPYVKFPHSSHTRWLACSNCHEKIFISKAGANPVTMTKIFRGEYCGVCHGQVAFISTFSCERCHSIPHGDRKSWW